MKVEMTEIKDTYIIEPRLIEDERGYFYEIINIKELEEHGIFFSPVQENCSLSLKAGIIRGIHFQDYPKTQSKIVRCTNGRIIDIVVDLRKDSPSYMQYLKIELSSENKKQVVVPKGCAHAIQSLVDNTIIEYFADEYYSSQFSKTIRYNDPDLNIDWEIRNPILSNNDNVAPFFKDIHFYSEPYYGGT